MLLGLFLVAAPIAGWGYWQESYVEGQEVCRVCGLHRDVDRRGPFWFRSAPYPSRTTTTVAACSDHVWARSGGWR